MTITKQINWKTIMAGSALSAMLVLLACSGGEEVPEEESTTEAGTTEDASTEVNETDEEDTNDNEAPDSDSAESDENSDELSWGKGETELELGEIGEIQSTLGTFEATISDVSYLDVLDGENVGEGGVYVLAKVSITNTSDDALDAGEVSRAEIKNVDSDVSLQNVTYFEEVNNFEGDIAPGETVEGEVFSIQGISSEFKIILGNRATSNLLVWTVDGPESSS
ncbi:DUF4352 domain-containing protein [Aureibacillus halotolerans]|uniref:Uncharacterized protein DUF4352 n=1 Tax=Aureibacillus halotolerans TaxID=1508390 RepID=A0A4R6U797_9BACI|nr:DUF4352 domain-containing protein [Aureibacillus halotolerans]TDQ42211.1 uncharacterized protein DUF4352 [Aureibacillus halotolerans]